jgi:hypothetical protein
MLQRPYADWHQKPMQVEKLKEADQKFGWLWWSRVLIVLVIVPVLLVLAYVGFSLQGYTNDLGSRPMESWPLGTASLLLAALLTWVALRTRPPGRLHLALIGLAFAALFFSIWRPL